MTSATASWELQLFPGNLLIVWFPSFPAEEFPSAAPGHIKGKDAYL